MRNKYFKQFIQIVISLGIAVWIFWFLYKDIAFESLIDQIKSSNWAWILVSLLVSILGYFVRSWRWTLLIDAEEGKNVTLSRAYHAVMIGYLVNMLIPRAGEVARCGVLTRTNGISVGYLFGTVIVERSVDLLCLVSVIVLAFLVEKDLFLDLAIQLVDIESLGQSILSNLPIVVGGLAILVLLVLYILKRFRDHGLINKLQHFFREILSGLKRIGKLSNPTGFWISSVLLWVIYFLTMYTISLGIPTTANLSSGEILLVMVMGSIGMIAPVQGGIGTFHALVAFILIQLGISEIDGKIFAAIIHGTQVILVLGAGLVSWLIMMKLPSWIKPEQN
ncbi:lysylphosphatidylglycerol synthase transmembrane domain-containing protein [Algoriphagus sp. D3-2-R+10]|uniref:lysylphosphatidylglycerol synthase transmembrane domain-containing protein n=1 Tax=Algoriphagus aurantiacus TaxID=3103948 RepID=UPI002B3B9A3A|nr:lysylphosphatidylglycerol synthase transmembrane domain-containing protein [Algoriphagus sp. D3-2-R+10]MEB2774721.1 lysylphosphatidylglycerol synthase transmembrane domain-containing protein [Algoriphagus sp. D3-2-R+10]